MPILQQGVGREVPPDRHNVLLRYLCLSPLLLGSTVLHQLQASSGGAGQGYLLTVLYPYQLPSLQHRGFPHGETVGDVQHSQIVTANDFEQVYICWSFLRFGSWYNFA